MLTVTPQRSGFLSLTLPRANSTPVVRKVDPGAEERFTIPEGVNSVVVSFSSESAQMSQTQVLQKQQNSLVQQQTLKESSGVVNLAPQQDSVSVEIPVP